MTGATTRVYVPTDLAGLADLLATGEVAAPVTAHAVTDTVRREWSEADEDELEYEMLCRAAEDCVGARRVVVAADVEILEPGEAEDPSLVTVTTPIPLSLVAAVHADASEADAAGGGDLAWFATQEIDTLF